MMTKRDWIALAAMLGTVFLAHAAGRVTQGGGAQLAPSIAVYTLLAFVLAPRLSWPMLSMIAVACGLATMAATASPFPFANVPAHGVAFLLAAWLARALTQRDGEVATSSLALSVAATAVVSWTLFSAVSWLGLSGTAFVSQPFERFGLEFGVGYAAWWASGLFGIAGPTALVCALITPAYYRAVRRLLSVDASPTAAHS